jgi:putative lipoprotein
MQLKVALVSLGCWLAVVFSPTRARAEDAWWGPDKALHFGVSAGLGATGYGASSLVFENRYARAGAGAGLSLGAGVAKEIRDSLGYGTPSWKDLTWDAAGAAVGVGVALVLDLALSSPQRDLRQTGAGWVLRF